MLRENHEFLARRLFRSRNGAGANGGVFVGPPCCIFGGRADLAKQAGELFPLTIFAAAAHGVSERFKATEGGDFSFELADSTRRGGLIENLLLNSLNLVIWRIIKVLHVLSIERRSSWGDDLCRRAALQEFKFSETLLQAFAAPVQRLVDGLGRGC